jgi:hypothetical protein
MKTLHYIFFINCIHKVELYFIQNQNKPICANCKFFISNKNECSKFGDVNIITGKYSYEPSTNVRNDEEKCGDYAIFFKKNYFKFITIPYYFLLEHYEIIISLSFSLSPFILLNNNFMGVLHEKRCK